MPIIGFHPFSDKTSNFAEPPKPASKNVPDWYRQQPTQAPDKTNLDSGEIATTIKKCMPIFDAMTVGYLIATPCDIYINATDPENLVYSIPKPMAEFKADLFSRHAFEQYSDYPIDPSKYHN